MQAGRAGRAEAHRLLLEAQHERERAARAGLAVDDDLSAHQRGEPFDDREPEAGAAVEPGVRDVALGERLEDHGLTLGGDADTRVDDGEVQHDVGGCVADR